MSFLPSLLSFDIHTLYHLLLTIGPLFLFFCLVAGIVGLPIPDEILLMGAGYLVSQSKLPLIPTVIASIAGSMCGITINYLLGRLFGTLLIEKGSKTFKMNPTKIETAKSWFKNIGKWVLIIGYFIPIFRHIVGFVAGILKLDYKSFALYAYTGAIIWSLTFLAIGYLFSSPLSKWVPN